MLNALNAERLVGAYYNLQNNSMAKEQKRETRGAKKKEGEKKVVVTASALPSVKEQIIQYHGSLTRFIEYAHLNDLIKIKLKK